VKFKTFKQPAGSRALLLCAWLSAFAGCKQATPADAVQPLAAAFAKAPEPSAGPLESLPSGATLEDYQKNKELAETAVAATRGNDLLKASMSLQQLRTTHTLTVEQRIAAQEAMSRFQKALAERAVNGDPAAIDALDSLRGSHLR
jgi:hypothetical protein